MPRAPVFSLLGLPDELLLQIIAHLPPEHVIPLHRTSRRLRSLTRFDKTLWRSLCAYNEALGVEPRGQDDFAPPVDATAVWPYPTESRVDWYSEYKYRYASLSTRWVSSQEDEAKGLACFGAGRLLAPLGDGGVSIWNTQDSTCERSKPGILFGSSNWESRRKARGSEIGDSVVVDEATRRIWVAGEGGLVELDLNTLQRVSTTLFPFAITTLSSSAGEHPLTVGTTLTLHLHDPRLAGPGVCTELPENYVHHAPLFQPGPLSILHHPDNQIYVAGRFPSILTYDRRSWPRLAGTVHSGGRGLCSLSTSSDGVGILAGGEYNGRGTLENYPLRGLSPKEVNRQTASRSKLLTVALHGARVLVGDGDGVLTWFERDCRTLVRRQVVDMPPILGASGGMWTGLEAGDPVRKVVVLNDAKGDAGDALGLWCGDRVGVMTPGKPKADDEWEMVETGEELREREMREGIRRALEQSADEVRFLGRLRGM